MMISSKNPFHFDLQSLNNVIKLNKFAEGYFTEANHPFTLKPKFSTLTSVIEKSSNIEDSQISFTPDDSMRDLLGFKPIISQEEKNLSDSPVDILPFDAIFLESVIARDMIFRDERGGIFQKTTMTKSSGYI